MAKVEAVRSPAGLPAVVRATVPFVKCTGNCCAISRVTTSTAACGITCA
jgi:hypothetical protein